MIWLLTSSCATAMVLPSCVPTPRRNDSAPASEMPGGVNLSGLPFDTPEDYAITKDSTLNFDGIASLSTNAQSALGCFHFAKGWSRSSKRTGVQSTEVSESKLSRRGISKRDDSETCFDIHDCLVVKYFATRYPQGS